MKFSKYFKNKKEKPEIRKLRLKYDSYSSLPPEVIVALEIIRKKINRMRSGY